LSAEGRAGQVNSVEFNTAGLNPWAGLKPPEAGGPADIALLGVPIDRGSVYRKGAAQAPATLRSLSAVFAPVSERAEHFGDLVVEDLGDISLNDGDMGTNVEAVAGSIERLRPKTIPIILGGDHTTVSPTLLAQQRRHGGRISVLYIDAHPDLNATSRGSRWSNGCALRRGLELGEIDPRRVLILGCRDFDWEEVEYARKSGITLIPAALSHGTAPGLLRSRIEEVSQGSPLHISLDIDSLDPSTAPGTGIPAAGGLTSRELFDLMYALRGLPLAGLDLDEVSPPLDFGQVTSLTALKFIFEFMAAVRLGAGS
jgi:arginase family enzyme